MTPIFKQHGAAIIYVITAIVMVVSALLLKGTAYENAWLYIFGVGFVLAAFWEFYFRKKNKDK